MSYIAFDLDALNVAPDVARAAGLHEDKVITGLARMWAWCFRSSTDRINQHHVVGFFSTDCAGILVSFGFLEAIDDGWRVRGADRYLRVAEGRSRGGKIASGNLKRGTQKPAKTTRLAPDLAPALPGLAPGSLPAPLRLDAGLSPNTEHRTPNTEHLLKEDRAGEVERLRVAWNEITTKPLPRWIETPPQRERAAVKALERRPLAEWREVFKLVETSEFCRGANDRGWHADPDWAIRAAGTKPEPALKLLEGAFAGVARLSKGPTDYDAAYWENQTEGARVVTFD